MDTWKMCVGNTCRFCRNFVESSEVSDGLLRVFHHPAMAERMQSLHKGHQDAIRREQNMDTWDISGTALVETKRS